VITHELGADAGRGDRRSMAGIVRGSSSQVRGNPMAKAALGERDLGSGGAAGRDFAFAAAGRGAGNDSMRRFAGDSAVDSRADGEDRKELAAGYQRIKLKCKPGWDVEVFERVRNRWPEIMLSCDANSAYKLQGCGPPGGV
jgi:o-succinylbenzoate synthase